VLGAAAAELSPELAAFEKRTGHQMVVAAFQSLDEESLEDYTNRLFRAWKIGSAKGDDGVLFALFVQDRKWRVEVGYGLEPVLTDLEAAELARSGVPQFQRGDYGGGTLTVVRGLEARVSGGPRARAPQAPQGRPYTDEELDLLWRAAVIPGLFFLLVFILLRDSGGTIGRRGGGWGGGGFGGGGFSGGGGSSGGGGASGGW
jgi:uncharacterized protein